MIALVSMVAAVLVVEQLWSRRQRLSRAWAGALAATALALVALALWSVPNLMVLGKVAGHLAMPVGLLWVALFGLVVAAWHRRRWRRLAALSALWLGFTLAGNEFLGAHMLWWLQRDFQGVDPFAERPFEALLVLGGGTVTTDTGGVALSEAGDRPILAARMYRAGQAEVLVASGRSIAGLGPPRDAAEETATLWRSLGVPAAAIVTLSRPRNTREEMAAYRELIERRGWERVGLITSGSHLRRALGHAREAGLELVPIPAESRGPPAWEGVMSVIPEGKGFYSVHRACWELLGAAVGR